MSSADQVSRLLALVPWLQARAGATVAEAADWFGVTESQLREDLEHLDYCGLPGLRGGDLFEVHIDDDRITLLMADELRRPLRLTPRESLRLALQLEAVAQALGDELPALRSALDKMRSRANLPALRVDLAEPGGWHSQLRQAIASRRQVILDYQGRGDATPRRRTVDPWTLQVHGGHWYLAGHDHDAGARRSFRLDRIVAVEVTQDPVVRAAPAGPLPPPVYEPHAGDEEVTVAVTPRGRWLAGAVGGADVTERGDGGATLVFTTDAPAWIVELVLAAQGEAELVAPSHLRQRVVDVAQAGLEALATD